MNNSFLLDMDGVLVDFTSSALELFNRELNKDITLEDYVNKQFGWNIQDVYEISVNEFWSIIDSKPFFWLKLKPFPWAKLLVDFLRKIGDVTIVTTPSLDPECAKQKLQWLDSCLNIKSNDVFIGSKKYLMAGNGTLIDDAPNNVNKFIEYGGKAILVPSNWNTRDLNFNLVKQTILDNL